MMQFQIRVDTYMGFSFTLDVEPTETIETIQMKIQIQEGIFHFSQRIMFGNKQLYDTYKTLNDYGISEGSLLKLVVRLCGRAVIKIGPSEFLRHYFGANISIKKLKKIISDDSEQEYDQFFEMYDLFGKHGRCKDESTFGEEDITHTDCILAVLNLKTKSGKSWYLEDKCQSLVFGYVRSIDVQNQLKYQIPTEIKSIIAQYSQGFVFPKEAMRCAVDILMWNDEYVDDS